MPDRADRCQSHSFNAYWKGAQRGLTANVDLSGTRDRLTECDFELAIRAFVDHVPGDDMTALDIQDFAGAMQPKVQRFQLASQRFVVNQMVLTK